MKNLIVIAVAALMLSGCALNCNEVMGQKSVWASPQHLWFSIQGYKHTTAKDRFNSLEENWWGCPVLYDE